MRGYEVFSDTFQYGAQYINVIKNGQINEVVIENTVHFLGTKDWNHHTIGHKSHAAWKKRG